MTRTATTSSALARNRQASHEYTILETFEAGIELTGTEVKALRDGRTQLREGYVRIENGEAWLLGVNIAEYSQGNRRNHEPQRRRRLLLHKREIEYLGAKVAQQGLTLVPLPATMAGGFGTRALGTRAFRARGLRRAARHSCHSRILAKAGGSVPAKLAAATVAASCVAAGGVAVVHLHGARPAAATHHVQAAPAALPTPVTQALARPSPKPVRQTHPPRKPAPPAPAAPASNAKKGVAAWAFSGAGQALAQSGASWYYTWSATPAGGIISPPGVRFVPLIWGAANVNAAALSQVRGEGPDLLGFNEPDMSGQANMTPTQALSLWPQLMATGLKLGSPAVADGGATPGGWLDQFMSGAAARGYRVNFITLHWYGADFATGPAVSQLESYLQAVHARYHKPIWLTEFALANFGGSPQTPTRREQAAFLTAATAMLQRLSYVQRYAWFGLEATPTDGSMGLFRTGPSATTVGRAFEAAG